MSKRIPEKDFLYAIEKSMGNVSAAAKILGCSRQTVHSRINTVPRIKEAHEEFRQKAIDNAESALQSAVLNGEAWAVCFTLKTIGKSRGYVERQELEHFGRNEGAIEISITERLKKYEELFKEEKPRVTKCNTPEKE